MTKNNVYSLKIIIGFLILFYARAYQKDSTLHVRKHEQNPRVVVVELIANATNPTW